MFKSISSGLNIFFLLFSISGFALVKDSLNERYFTKLEYSFFTGKIIPHHQSIVPLSKQIYIGQEIRLCYQTDGSEDWHLFMKYPVYGIGLYSGYSQNKTIGNPMALFGFLEFPYKRFDNSWLGLGVSMGCAFHFNEFDSVKNPENVAISTDLNVYLDLIFTYKHQFKNHIELGTGLKFQHFSNGAINFPNYGLNLVTIQTTLGFLNKKNNKVFIYRNPKPFIKKHEIYLFEGMGWNAKSLKENNVKYFNNSFTVFYNYQFNRKHTFGTGFDIFYNEGNKEYFNGNSILFKNYLSYAGIVGTDLLISKFRMTLQFGVYLFKPIEDDLNYYERIALRYYFLPAMFANLSLKAYAFKAQYIEWGMGWIIN